ncbi:hypothetical protein CC80DRAFT_490072 [Byssothecium circinans]|uniref:TAP-C domain-containing protein n=1 Tax=Byssothecium circinans TaxID=147558 RepID=A0A6A5U2L4_9PLEO|nr:hypothetical protein CC80DRAFT_490072 [Byssothecium circinans]
MPGPTRTHGGIRKHHQRRDRDGDIAMSSAPRASPGRSTRGAHSGSSHKTSAPTPPFTELQVTGWTDDKEKAKLLGFLERHSSRRSANVAKSHVPPKMIKRHRIAGTTLTIWVRPEDVVAFSKINGFSFASAHGSQKLTITGPGIRAKSPNTSTAAMDTSEDKESSSEVADMLKHFLQRRYNAEDKLLNLNTIAEDEEVAKSGMFNSEVTQSKFFPALMVICQKTLETAGQDKREVINSVTLSGNNLPNVEIIKSLAIKLPHIRNLDLSGNKFASIKDLKAFKNRFRFLEHLIIEIAQAGWEEELISWFPKLRILNGVQVRPEPSATTNATTNGPAIIPAAPVAPVSGFTLEQEDMIAYVQKETNLKRELAVQCLEAGGWDIDTAAQLFLAQKDNLPSESFD